MPDTGVDVHTSCMKETHEEALLYIEAVEERKREGKRRAAQERR